MNNFQQGLIYSSPYLKIRKEDVRKFGSNYLEAIGYDDGGAQKPDSKGFYTTILGALNVKNRGGDAYAWPLSKPAFSDESFLRRKLGFGSLIAEMDHPLRSDYKNKDEYDRRLGTFLKEKQCAVISEVWIDESGSIKKHIPANLIWPNSEPVLIMGKVKPVGIYGKPLEEAFQDPAQNVFFSMRTISRQNRVTGELILDVLTGFDWVAEGGVIVSNSWLANAADSFRINESSVDSMRNLINDGVISNHLGVNGAQHYLEDSSREYYQAVIDAHGRIPVNPLGQGLGLEIIKPSYL